MGIDAIGATAGRKRPNNAQSNPAGTRRETAHRHSRLEMGATTETEPKYRAETGMVKTMAPTEVERLARRKESDLFKTRSGRETPSRIVCSRSHWFRGSENNMMPATDEKES